MTAEVYEDTYTEPDAPARVLNPERALLGAVLSGFEDVPGLARVVKGADFADPKFEQVWVAVLATYADGATVDPLTVLDRLPADVRRRRDTAPLLHSLMAECPATVNAPAYAEQVSRRGVLAKLNSAGMAIQQIASGPVVDVQDAITEAQKVLDTATREQAQQSIVMVGELLDRVLDENQAIQRRGLPTPWPELDRIVPGSQRGHLNVVGGRPGEGKSTIGLQVAVDAAYRHGVPALFVSLEMGLDELQRHLVSQLSDVQLSYLKDLTLTDQMWKRIGDVQSEISLMPLGMSGLVSSGKAPTLPNVRALVREHARRFPDLWIVVVDYLQLLEGLGGPRQSRQESVGEVSRGLKRMAREFDVCVWAMAQVNRDFAKANRRPQLSDLRESGAIEADADNVFLLHQPNGANDDLLRVIVAKQRDGPLGECDLSAQFSRARLASRVSWAIDEQHGQQRFSDEWQQHPPSGNPAGRRT